MSEITDRLDSFFSSFPQVTLKKGTTFIQAGEAPSGVYYIEKGIVRDYWISKDGMEITLNMYKPHAFIPMSWAIGNVVNSHFYDAMTDVVVRKAPKERVVAFIKNEPDILYDLLQRIYIGMEGLWKHIESLSGDTSYNKLISSLIVFAKRFGKEEKDKVIIQLKLSETALANYAGMSRETASRELQKLKKRGLIFFEKGIMSVANIQKLEEEILL